MSYCLTVLSFTLVLAEAFAIERKTFAEISIEALVQETQIQLEAGDRHMAIAWWIPHEYWQTTLSRDLATPNENKEAILQTLSGYTLLGVVQADINLLGAFEYYTLEEVRASLEVSIRVEDSGFRRLQPIMELDENLKFLLDSLRPILGNAMGNLGSSFRFFVFSRFDEDQPVVNPYHEGSLHIALRKRDATPIHSAISFPLDALFVPRLCPNGKPAHVTWKYCPWTGKELP